MVVHRNENPSDNEVLENKTLERFQEDPQLLAMSQALRDMKRAFHLRQSEIVKQVKDELGITGETDFEDRLREAQNGVH